jgi:hypothetical protein
MFTEQRLHDHPSLVKALMGISAEQFWELIEKMTRHFATWLRTPASSVSCSATPLLPPSCAKAGMRSPRGTASRISPIGFT